jgi:hypothetical protein
LSWRTTLAMSRVLVHHLAICGVVAVLAAPLRSAAAEDGAAYDVDQDRPLSLRALLDARVVGQGPRPSTLEGGPGKTRYGGVIENNEAETITRFALSQFALQPVATLPWGIRAWAQLNWDVDVDTNGDAGAYSNAPRLVEGLLRKEWGGADRGGAIQGGVTTPAFSLENTGPAWTPLATLTPSAANTWLWQDVKPVGLEGEWWGSMMTDFQIDTAAGVGWGSDQLGTALAHRGWVLSDYLSGVNSAQEVSTSGPEWNAFYERDGTPAVWGGASVSDPLRLAELRVGYFDNLGNLSVNGVWETRFGEAGLQVEPLAGLEILTQGMVGNTTVRGKGLESRFSSWYSLVSYRYAGNRFSVRYDNFSVTDVDGPPATAESGYAVTFAYLLEFWLRHRVGFEYIYVDSERPGGAPHHMSQRGWQLSYRFRY